MNYLNTHQFDLGAENQQDAAVSTEMLQRRADQLKSQIEGSDELPADRKMSLIQSLAETRVALGQGSLAWQSGKTAFDYYLRNQKWEQAVVCCDIMFRSEFVDALIALGNGLWLSITFPVDPELSVLMLRHVIEDTPSDSDGAAVAAAVAAYVVEIRGDQHRNDDASLVVGQLLNEVARRHGNANSAEEFNRWFKRLELDQPAKFLVRMRNVIDVLVQDQWWFDRGELQQLIPQDQ